VTTTVPIRNLPQSNPPYLDGLKSSGQVSQVNRGPEKPANVHSSQSTNFNIAFGSTPNPNHIQPSVSGSSQADGGGSVGGQVGQAYSMQMFPGPTPPRQNHPIPQVLPSIKSWRFVNQNAGSGSGSNRGQRQSTQNYPQQQQASFMVPSPIFQHTPIYIQQPTFVPNQHRMPNSNQQPQQFVQPIQYTNYSTNQQPLPYMNQSYQSSTYPQTNQPHQPVATQHVTQTQPQNNPYPQPPAQQHPQMLVQNTTLQQREKKNYKHNRSYYRKIT